MHAEIGFVEYQMLIWALITPQAGVLITATERMVNAYDVQRAVVLA
jgi:hypothetical protein